MATVLNQETEHDVDLSDMLYEVVDGQIVEKTMGAYELALSMQLCDLMRPFALQHKLGHVFHEMMFVIPPDNRQRRPDLAFVSYDRWPRNKSIPRTAAWDVVPELAIEIVSPTNAMTNIVSKVGEYFAGGVRLVWVVLPQDRQVYVYDSPDRIRVVTAEGELDGEAVVPGFRMTLSELFPNAPDLNENDNQSKTAAE